MERAAADHGLDLANRLYILRACCNGILVNLYYSYFIILGWHLLLLLGGGRIGGGCLRSGRSVVRLLYFILRIIMTLHR